MFNCSPFLAINAESVIVAIGVEAERLIGSRGITVINPFSSKSIADEHKAITTKILQHVLYMLGKLESFPRKLASPTIKIEHAKYIDCSGFLLAVRREIGARKLYVNGRRSTRAPLCVNRMSDKYPQPMLMKVNAWFVVAAWAAFLASATFFIVGIAGANVGEKLIIDTFLIFVFFTFGHLVLGTYLKALIAGNDQQCRVHELYTRCLKRWPA